MKPSVIIIISYFGIWPEWINLFMESCRLNPTIDWIIYSDCGACENTPANVQIRAVTYADYCARIAHALKIDFRPEQTYKLCETKIMTGMTHAQDIKGYDFFGYGDIDLVYGNIRDILKTSLSSDCNLISTHSFLVSGHFALMRNSFRMRNAFRMIPSWRTHVLAKDYVSVDEHRFSKVFWKLGGYNPLYNRINAVLFRPRTLVFDEQYTTPMIPFPWHNGSMDHPQNWVWKDGNITNDRDGDRRFLYLHFMNWRHARYAEKQVVQAGAWAKVPFVMRGGWRDMLDGFSISPEGIAPLNRS